MNREALTFNLLQASHELRNFIKECESGQFDDAGPYVLGQRFANILNYLCNAWHHRKFSSETIKLMSQEDYEKYSTLIPNFCYRFHFDESFEESPIKVDS